MEEAPSLAGRACLALLLMIGFYVLALGLCVALGILVYHDLQSRRVHGRFVFFAAVTMGIVLWSVLPRPVKLPADREALSRHAVCVDSGIPAEHLRGAAAWMFGVLLSRALVRAGFAAETGPGEPVALVRGANRLEPFAVTAAIVDGTIDAAAWTETCRLHGIGDQPLSGPHAVSA